MNGSRGTAGTLPADTYENSSVRSGEKIKNIIGLVLQIPDQLLFYTFLRMKIFIRLHRAFLLVNYFKTNLFDSNLNLLVEKHGGDE